MSKRLYLDDAAATALDPSVLKVMVHSLKTLTGNPASLHQEGTAAKEALEAARRSVAEMIEAHADEIVFTSGGTESNNLAIFGVVLHQKDKRHIVTSTIEHPSVARPINELERRGFSVTRLPVSADGLVDIKTFEAALRPDTCLASITFANNEIGTVQPIAELGKIAQRHNVLFHTDACQAAAWIPLRVEALHIDLMTINAAKLHGPKGVGLLYVKRGRSLQPILYGGGQEQGARSGTENVPAIVAFAEAFRRIREQQADAKRVSALRDQFIVKLLAVPGVRLNGHPTLRLPNNINLSIEGVEGETLILGFDAQGIAVSTGSACSSIHREGSPVLKALGIPDGAGNLRITIPRKLSVKDMDRVVQALKNELDRQRPLQPVWKSAVEKGKEKFYARQA